MFIIFDVEECEPPDMENAFLLASNDDALNLLE